MGKRTAREESVLGGDADCVEEEDGDLVGGQRSVGAERCGVSDQGIL